MRYGITRGDDESGRERRGARLRGRERQRAAQAFEAGGRAMLEGVNVGREREFGRGQGGRMGKQVAVAASLQMGLQALRRRIAGVVAASRAGRAVTGKQRVDALVRGQRLRDRRRERGHQDGEHPDQTDDLPESTTQHAVRGGVRATMERIMPRTSMRMSAGACGVVAR